MPRLLLARSACAGFPHFALLALRLACARHAVVELRAPTDRRVPPGRATSGRRRARSRRRPAAAGNRRRAAPRARPPASRAARPRRPGAARRRRRHNRLPPRWARRAPGSSTSPPWKCSAASATARSPTPASGARCITLPRFASGEENAVLLQTADPAQARQPAVTERAGPRIRRLADDARPADARLHAGRRAARRRDATRSSTSTAAKSARSCVSPRRCSPPPGCPPPDQRRRVRARADRAVRHPGQRGKTRRVASGRGRHAAQPAQRHRTWPGSSGCWRASSSSSRRNTATASATATSSSRWNTARPRSSPSRRRRWSTNSAPSGSATRPQAYAERHRELVDKFEGLRLADRPQGAPSNRSPTQATETFRHPGRRLSTQRPPRRRQGRRDRGNRARSPRRADQLPRRRQGRPVAGSREPAARRLHGLRQRDRAARAAARPGTGPHAWNAPSSTAGAEEAGIKALLDRRAPMDELEAAYDPGARRVGQSASACSRPPCRRPRWASRRLPSSPARAWKPSSCWRRCWPVCAARNSATPGAASRRARGWRWARPR